MWLLPLAATPGCARTRDINTLIERLTILPVEKAPAENLSLSAWGCMPNGDGANADMIAGSCLTTVDVAETATLIEQALDPDGTVRDHVKLEARWHIGQSALGNQL